jgi:nitrate reductase alpha subunit
MHWAASRFYSWADDKDGLSNVTIGLSAAIAESSNWWNITFSVVPVLLQPFHSSIARNRQGHAFTNPREIGLLVL